jgi:hypothetical protein
MGSSRRRHSTGKAGSVPARKGKHKKPDHERQPPKPDVDAILGQLSDALSIVATATRSLVADQNSGRLADLDSNEAVHTLEDGLRGLRRAYNDLDEAVGQVP